MTKKYKPAKPAILYVTDNGDPSVGILECGWEVQAPFTKKEVKVGAVDKESVEFFRNETINIYKEFAQGQVTAIYNFELKKNMEF